ncbi:hypothetical protein PMAYCL1PPCAC_07906, partial [Pristionchus mayeri]
IVEICSEYVEIMIILLLIGSIYAVNVDSTQSVHRFLLIVAISVRIPNNHLLGLTCLTNPDPSVDDHSTILWTALPLFYPIVYFFTTRNYEKKDGIQKEDDIMAEVGEIEDTTI